MKPVKEIEVLDPACGTMHFGLVAFDLLAEMYREEMEHAGQLGWPEKPSVSSAEAIPAAIVINNIFGIDIDLRAVQLSALALYLKAKSLNPKAAIIESLFDFTITRTLPHFLSCQTKPASIWD